MDPKFGADVALKHGVHETYRPIVVAPAMNTFMWHRQCTAEGLRELRRRGVVVVDPVVKRLACGDLGTGALAQPSAIVNTAITALECWGQKAADTAEAGLLPLR